MADINAVIETQEHRWMRAWVGRDLKTLKAMTARNFVMVIASRPPMILDTPSWLEAAKGRFACRSYRFGEVHVRKADGAVMFATRLELEAEIDGQDWSGPMWVTDLWRKGKVRRHWKLTDRILSRTDEKPELPKALRALQLWR
jgi:hypothetical protein